MTLQDLRAEYERLAALVPKSQGEERKRLMEEKRVAFGRWYEANRTGVLPVAVAAPVEEPAPPEPVAEPAPEPAPEAPPPRRRRRSRQ